MVEVIVRKSWGALRHTVLLRSVIPLGHAGLAMLSFITCSDERDRYQAVPVPVPIENLKPASVVKLWCVRVNHLFYVMNGDENLYACCVSSSPTIPHKSFKIPLDVPLRNLLSARSNHVVLVFDDGSVRTLHYSREDGWIDGIKFHLPLEATCSIEYASICAESNLFWIQRSSQFRDEVGYSLWKCSLSWDSDDLPNVQCIAHRLPPFHLYVLKNAVIVIPCLPDPPNIYLSFGATHDFKMGSLAKQAVLLTTTLSSPLDVAAFYKRHIRFWQVQTHAAVVHHSCVSPLANCLYLLLKDNTVIMLRSSGEVLQQAVLQDVSPHVLGCCIVASTLCLFEDSAVQLYDLTSGSLLEELTLQGSFRGVLPSLWAFWTTEGVYRLTVSGSTWCRNSSSQLQSEALVYAAFHAGAETTPGLPTEAQVRTKLNRILHPLVECYWKLQQTKVALTS